MQYHKKGEIPNYTKGFSARDIAPKSAEFIHKLYAQTDDESKPRA